MTRPVEPLTDFDALRRVGIDYAQKASGQIWTDYNIHDPGVTLLEQTCFALSQIAYQVSLPTRDLLTNARGHFTAHDLALFKPRKVLGTDPVTPQDLAAWLCACPDIDSVNIAEPAPGRAGLFNITIVPSARGEALPDPEAAFRATFDEVRPLCTDLAGVALARPVDVTLHGQVEIGSEALPENAAAALYLTIAQILTGADFARDAASRADVWDAPEKLLAPAQSRSAQSLDLSKHLARLRDLTGVRDITALWLDPGGADLSAESGPVYFRLRVPRRDADIALTMTLDSAPVMLSAARLREEYTRLAAETIAEATHHIDRLDWDVMKPGRHRRFTHGHVDALLPALYRIPYQHDMPFDARQLFNAYRGAIDTQLKEMVDTLTTLPRRFTAEARASETDPLLHRLRLDLLDYLIALQGCEMPATRHSGLHRYMSTAARHRFEVSWRLEYLFALPELSRGRATGPGPSRPGGFMAELAILCDFDLHAGGAPDKPLGDYGLRIDPEAALAAEDSSEDLILIAAHNPFDMLVPEDDRAAPYSPDEFSDLTPFLTDGALSPALLAHLAGGDSFAIAPAPGGDWWVLFDPGDGVSLRPIGGAVSKKDAIARVTRMRATWRHLNRSCEAALLVEHVRLGATDMADANTADLILPGFTARTAMESYRSYVRARVEALAPAHVHIRLHWLSPAQLSTLADQLETARDGSLQDKAALRLHLDALAAEAGA